MNEEEKHEFLTQLVEHFTNMAKNTDDLNEKEQSLYAVSALHIIRQDVELLSTFKLLLRGMIE